MNDRCYCKTTNWTDRPVSEGKALLYQSLCLHGRFTAVFYYVVLVRTSVCPCVAAITYVVLIPGGQWGAQLARQVLWGL